VIPLVTADTIYAVPLEIEDAGLGRLVEQHFGFEARVPRLDEWRDVVARIRAPKPQLEVAVVGKYVQLPDAYKSVSEALMHAGLFHGVAVRQVWIDSEDLERGRSWDRLQAADGVVVSGGFGHRGIEGKIQAARYCREQQVPYLGLCLGLQVMVIELGRLAFGTDEPNSTEFDPATKFPVIALLPEQVGVTDMGGTMRLGAWPCRLVPGTRTAECYGRDLITERHRHRFEVNPLYLPTLRDAGLVVSGLYTERDLVDVAEVAGHPFMVGSQFHPEFRSRPLVPHPLFRGFMAACRDRHFGRAGAAAEVAAAP
jgi:CTP synthase